jgi:predicted phage-related endonuclease
VTLTTYPDLMQGSDEWLAARLGMLTASEMKLLVSPQLKALNNDKTRAHIWELLAQRITQHVEPAYISDDMLRGREDEIAARDLYAEEYAPVTECGFMVRDFGGFRIGYSPDGLVNDDGLIECKSRRAKFQVETIVGGEVPTDYLVQIQTGLLVSGRAWCDFISYSGGLPMAVYRVPADPNMAEAILDAAHEAEARIQELQRAYLTNVNARGFRMTERRIEQEMVI